MVGSAEHPALAPETLAYLRDLSTAQIKIAYITSGRQFQKGEYVRSGFDWLLQQDEAPDLLSFMDYSYKISVLEVIPMLARILETPHKIAKAAVIGSRRHELSEVLRKSEALHLRSMVLNILVKSLFPLLYNIQDTQTGLKIIGRDLWQGLNASPWVTSGYGFDIELLQKIARRRGPQNIQEMPVAFFDNTEQLGLAAGEKVIFNVFEELLKVRALVADTAYYDQDDLRFVAGGADRKVFEYRGKILKIPNETFDVDFYAFVKHLLLVHHKTMSRDAHAQRLVEHGLLDDITDQPLISKIIPLLRVWPEGNSWLIELISLLENKNYKSSGYDLAFAYGDGLIVPMSVLARQPGQPEDAVVLAVKYAGRAYNFTEADNILIAQKADVLRNRLVKIIQSNDLPGFQVLLAQVTGLMRRLWRRGLFDMDPNIIADFGYVENRLLLLDPGELIDNPNIELLRHMKRNIRRRTDYIELKGLLAGHALAQEMLTEYYNKATGLLDFMIADLSGIESLSTGARGLFGSDLRTSDSYVLQGPRFKQTAPPAAAGRDQRAAKLHFLFLAGADIQEPYQKRLSHIPDAPAAVPEHLANPGSAQVGQVLTAEPLQNPLAQNVLFAVQGGRGYRTRLLGLTAGGKENIMLNGAPLQNYALSGIAPLTRLSSAADDRLVILSSIDTYIPIDAEHFRRINEYFALPKSPGLFFYDLPAGLRRDIMPTTLPDLLACLQNSELFWRDLKALGDSVPFGAGYWQQPNNLAETALRAILNNFLAWSGGMQNPAGRGANSGMSLPFMGGLAASLKRFIVYRANYSYDAGSQQDGLKTPYLYIAKQSFLNDLRDSLNIPVYAAHDFTWYTLITAWKSDQSFWQLLKPALVDAALWQNIQDTLRELGRRHNIDLNADRQNELRVFNGEWAALDEPWYIAKFIKANSDYDETGEIITEKIFSGQKTNLRIDNRPNNQVIILGDPARIQGLVIITADFRLMRSRRVNVLYQIDLPAGKTIELPKNHLLVQLDGEYYSMTMQPLSRDNLDQATVYKYLLVEGGIYIPVPHMDYAQFYNKFSARLPKDLLPAR